MKAALGKAARMLAARMSYWLRCAGEEERTREVFGDYVSIYDFAQSIADGATVPLYYESRLPELHLTNDELGDEIARVIEEANLDEDERSASRGVSPAISPDHQ